MRASLAAALGFSLIAFVGCDAARQLQDAARAKAAASKPAAGTDVPVVIAPESTAVAPTKFVGEERVVWRFKNGPSTVLFGEGTSGEWRKGEGKRWTLDRGVGGSPLDYDETSRTDAYVELEGPGHFVRLFDDRSEFRHREIGESPGNTSFKFQPFVSGAWGPHSDPEAIAARKFWRYENAPKVFPDQASFAGLFRADVPPTWVEDRIGSYPHNYREQARTDDYVELEKYDGSFWVRLYADRSEWRFADDAAYKPMFPGGWVGEKSLPATSTPGPTIAATPPAVDPNDRREAWRYVDAPRVFPDQANDSGVVRRLSGKEWVSERDGAPSQDFVEVARTKDYVEMSRPDGGFFMRLYDGRSEYRYGNQTDYSPMFPGSWE